MLVSRWSVALTLVMRFMVASSSVPGASSNQTSGARPTDTTRAPRASQLDLLHMADVEDLKESGERAGDTTDILEMAMVAFEEHGTAPALKEATPQGTGQSSSTTHELLYELSLKDLLKRRAAKDPKWLLWNKHAFVATLASETIRFRGGVDGT
ncbi:uncharacterized protein J7T54_000137 [Emericellopsis cladophorae]|uniref:RxLR effector candidate protein n=1 Tax=Emericellopsis cladophorae TaxID=2686198 RepID=A0A9P9XZS4_9HYPO|nr:uncharacterized protein J7T54_000137 [Emericellopsis cladophorae]KAI6780498.1 hypothetical protein J7T54_000137 [Emericellopsis cladophorae]